MSVDDAGTRRGAMPSWSLAGARTTRPGGFEGAVGYGPIDNVEVEVSFARARDGSVSPSARFGHLGAAIKWVPLQAETGLSAGLKYEYGNEHAVGIRLLTSNPCSVWRAGHLPAGRCFI